MELKLNDRQQEAVECTNGPLLIIAGAGSGKTRVLTHRISYLINHEHVNPWNILAITFTNKAAEEMRERVDDTTGGIGGQVWVSTFHSLCVRILHRYIDRLGFDTSFSIYDSDDQKQVIKRIIKTLDLDTKMWKEKMFISKISHAKERMIDAKTYAFDNSDDYKESIIAKVYTEYEKELKKSNALDFDDLLLKTVELFRDNEDILKNYQNRFKYIMVDEYQDTNTVQFMLVELLAREHKNLCVVGDDDQSIYAFRGADIRNILNFEKYFKGAKVVKLEENYRSTSYILDAANAVISNNKSRKEKKLWTSKDGGAKLRLKNFDTGYEEASFIARDIEEKSYKLKCDYNDFAVLYRTNAQSRLIEEKLIYENIPYKLVGGVNFYARKEIKDVLAYLKLIDNLNDELSIRRIINVPKRGIGATTLEKIASFAASNALTFYEGMENADSIPNMSRSISKVNGFVNLTRDLQKFAQTSEKIADIIDYVLEKTGYLKELELENTDEARARIENIDEFRNKAIDFDKHNDGNEDGLTGEIINPLTRFLEEVSLIADIDSLDDRENRVTLMTLHGSKGLEFKNVYMAGMEEGMFPSYMSINSENEKDVEEERRLCYVGITRAKENLTLCFARTRMVHGETRFNTLSRFVCEIPESLIEKDSETSESIFIDRQERNSFGSGYGYSNKSYGNYSKASGRGRKSYDSAYSQEDSYIKRKEDFNNTISFDLSNMKGSNIVVNTDDGLDYEVGDRVRHIKFGEGVVKDIEEGVRDFKVTVEFDMGETRSMFAAFAKLEKIENE